MAGLAALLTLIIYLAALQNDFVLWDDDLYVLKNPHIQSLNASFFKWAIFTFHAYNWHPLTWISHALDYAVWGLNPLGHHLTNIIFHAVNTFVVVFLMIRLLETKKEPTMSSGARGFLTERAILMAAGVTGLLFGLHPVHVESVAWVSERKDLLCALFYLLTISMYVRHLSVREHQITQKKIRSFVFTKYYFWACGFFILALLSKPMAVTLPVVLLILDSVSLSENTVLSDILASSGREDPLFRAEPFFINHNDSGTEGRRGHPVDRGHSSARPRAGGSQLPCFLSREGALAPGFGSLLSLSEAHINIVFRVSFRYCPGDRDYGSLHCSGKETEVMVDGLGYLCRDPASRPWYCPSGGPVNGRPVYVSAEPWAIPDSGLGSGMDLGKSKQVAKVEISHQGICCRCSRSRVRCAILSDFQTNRHLENSIDLWSYVIRKEPERVPLAYNNRGLAYGNEGLFKEAFEDLSTAIILDSSYDLAYSARGTVFGKMGLYARAIEDYNKAIVLEPGNYLVYNNLGIVYSKTGLYDKAAESFSKAIAIKPDEAEIYFNRGLAYSLQDQDDRALADYNKALELKQDYATAYRNRGDLYQKSGRKDLALADFRKACELGDEAGCNALR